MNKYYDKSWGEVVEAFGTNTNKGLMEYECILKRETYGDNNLVMPRKNKVDLILKESLNKEITILQVLLLLSFFISKNYWLLIIGFIFIVLNIGFNISINIKRYRNLTSLVELNTSKVIVFREGIERIVEAHEIMIGDIVSFKKGSFISADLRIIESDGLKVDESSVTGEEFLKEKYETKMDYQVSKLGEINNMLFRGTIIKNGEGRGIVTEIGNKTELGKILLSLENKNSSKSNILKNVYYKLAKINLVTTIISVLLYVIVPGSGQVKNNVLNNALFITTILCVPLISFIYSNFIKGDLNAKGIDLFNFSALDDNKSVKLLFIEKFGSITKRELKVNKIYSDEKYTDASNIDINDINIRRVIDIAYLNSDIYPNIKEKLDDINSAAYINNFEEKGIDRLKTARENHFRFRVGKDSQKQIVSTVTKNSKGFRVNSRGNLEDILQRSEYILINGVEHPLTTNEINKIKNADLNFSRDGLISEAVAYRSFSYEPSMDENIESHLVFVGLIGLENPFVDGLSEEIEQLFEEGILPIVFCDDNKIIGEVIGRRIGTAGSMNEVSSGVELSYMNDDEFYKTLSRTRVFCRVTPEQKSRIIDTYNKDGYKFAAEGENLGELSTVAISQIGIAKGRANKLLISISDFYTKISSISSLLAIRENAKKLTTALDMAGYMYIQFLLGQIFNIFNLYFLDDGILFSLTSMILLNLVFFTPLSLLAMSCGKAVSRNKHLAYIIAYIIISMISLIGIEKNTEFAMFAILSLCMLLTVLVNIKISFKSWNRDINLLIITVLIFLISNFIVYYYLKVVLDTLLILILTIIPITYLILIYIIKRWQS